MSLGQFSVIEVRPTGNSANGGGFNAVGSSAGTDYSQQDAAQLSLTDVVTNGTTTVTSVTGGFTAAMIRNWINIAGTLFEIIARASTNSITVDRATGTGTGQVGKVGGAFDSLLNLVAALPSNQFPLSAICWTKKGAGYTHGSALSLDTGSAVPNTNPCRIVGYGTARGDAESPGSSNCPTITASAAVIMVSIKSSNTFIENFILNGANTATEGLDGTGTTGPVGRGSGFRNITITACATRGLKPGGMNGQWALVYGMKAGATSGVTIGVGESLSYVFSCANPCPGFNGESIGGGAVLDNCIAANNTGASSDGFLQDTNLAWGVMRNCVSYKNGRDGVRSAGSYQALVVSGSVIYGNAGYGITSAIDTNNVSSIGFNYNAFGANGTAPRNVVSAGTNDIPLTVDPFINGGGAVTSIADVLANFALNNLVGGGLLLRNGGFNYSDIGALQHQDLGVMAQKVSNLRTLQSYGATNLSAGGTLTATTWDLHVALGGLLTLRFVNGGTAPSTAPTAIIYTSADGSTWRKYLTVSGDTVNSSTNDIPVEVPEEVMYLQVVFNGGTGQAVGVEALGQEMTALA